MYVVAHSIEVITKILSNLLDDRCDGLHEVYFMDSTGYVFYYIWNASGGYGRTSHNVSFDWKEISKDYKRCNLSQGTEMFKKIEPFLRTLKKEHDESGYKSILVVVYGKNKIARYLSGQYMSNKCPGLEQLEETLGLPV